MHKTLSYIAIQHELGMSTGLDLRLEPMLEKFTMVCIRCLGLTAVDYFFKRDKAATLALPQSRGKISHYLSIPRRKSDEQPQLSNPVLSLTEQPDKTEAICETSNGYIYYFNLADLGIIALHRRCAPLEPSLIELIKPVFQKLSLSCMASIEHAKLLLVLEEKKEAENTIAFKLNHDDLTDLANRQMLMKQLENAITTANTFGFYSALLFVDLNRFKTINDTFGHYTGDLLLKSVASLLLRAVRQNDVVARLSGDEFCVLLKNIGSEPDSGISYVNKIIARIQHLFYPSVEAGDHCIFITPSIGVDIFPGETSSAEQILRNADMAMYKAKSNAPNSSAFFDKKSSSDVDFRLKLESELKIALEDKNQFELFYQPQHNWAGLCTGAEALLRWKNPKFGMISPDVFIPLAEETGLMLDLGDWVTKRACSQLQRLELISPPETFKKVAINVSAVQFNQEGFVEGLHKIVSESGINKGLLNIELTESSIITNVDETVQKMQELRHHGISFSIDDFGTGYSSLSYLTKFPIETLKIDKAFIRNLHMDNGNKAIVNAIIALGQSLGLRLIAEGVETEEELLSLKMMGCNNYQGYYFEKPMPFEEFIKVLMASDD